jgi:hypothetical protein
VRKESAARTTLSTLLEENSQCRFRWAASSSQLDSFMEVDLQFGRKHLGARAVVTGPFELLKAPSHQLVFYRLHRQVPRLHALLIPNGEPMKHGY